MDEENDNFEFKDEIEIEYSCFVGCNEVFSSERKLRAHLKIHKKSSASADNDPVIQSSEITNNNHSDEEIRVLKAETRDKEFIDSDQAEESQSETPSPLQTEESAAGQGTGNLEVKNVAKLEFHCPQCRNFYTYQENFWKRQDALNISLSNITEVQDHFIGTTTNVKEQARDVATQTSEDNPLADFLEIEDPQNGNLHTDRSSYSRNSQNSQQSENEEEIQREMGNSEEFEIEDEIQFEFKCFTCCVTVTTQKDLWNHLNFHKKTLSKSKNLTQQNEIDNEQSELLESSQREGKLISSKKNKDKTAEKRRRDSIVISSSKNRKVESVTKNKKLKQPTKSIQSQGTAEVASTYLKKLRSQSEPKVMSSNQNLETLKTKTKNQEALVNKKVSNKQTLIDKESECNGKDQTTESHISDTNTSNPTDLNTQDKNHDQNFPETPEETRISIISQVSTDEIEDQIEENEIQAQEDISMFNCQVRVRLTSVFVCDECEEYFLTEQELTEHVKSHSNEINRTRTGSDQSKVRVENDRSESRKIMFECDTCGRQFRWKSHLKRHLPFHSTKKPYKCGTCEKWFKSKSDLKRHLLSVHCNVRPYKCGSCEKTFKYKHHLKDHQMRIHSDLRPYTCKTCQKRFKSKSDLKRHLLSVHCNVRPYKCGSCEKTFKYKHHLKDHQIRIHSELRLFTCKKCEKSFKTNQDLWSHQLAHTNKRLHKCQQCSKAFKRKDDLRKHLRRAHSDVRPYKCGSCDKTFKRKCDMKVHQMSMHSELRLFPCNKCSKAFKRKDHLRQHLRIHRRFEN